MIEPLVLERHGAVAVVTLNRPQARNALNLELCHALTATFQSLNLEAETAEGARVVVLRAAGTSFCAGADLKERQDKDAAWIRNRRVASFEAYRTISSCRVPTIALVHGAVVGSGGEIAMSCDFAYATPETTFRFPEAHWGTVGATQRLQRVIGLRAAKELLFTASPLNAEEAQRLGLIQRIFDADVAWSQVIGLAEQVASAPALSMRLTKSAMNAGSEVTLEQGISVEMAAIEHNLASGEWRAGLERFASDSGPGTIPAQSGEVTAQ